MEAITTLHHRHQPLCSSVHSSLTSATASSLFLSQPAPSPSPSSSSIRASSSSSSSSSPPPSSSDHLQNLQYPESKTLQFLNPLPKVPSFDPPLQDPRSKSPQFFNPIPKVPSFEPPLQDPKPKSPQFLNLIPKVPSFATLTAAASAFFFLGYCQHGFHKPITSLSSVVSIEEALDEKSDIGEFLGSKPGHVESVLHLKLRERVPIVHSFKKTKSDYEEAWQVLKAQIFSCSENLELVKVGFEEILEKDMDCNKAHHDRVLEYLEMVDECYGLLKGIKVAMNRCERDNADIKRCLRFFSKVVARIRVLEGDMVGALKYFKELEQE